MQLSGKKITIRRAAPEDAQRVYQWLAVSDLTPSMFGPPLFEDRRVPAPATFLSIYREHLFDGSLPFEGRGFIISRGGRDIGFVCSGPMNLLGDVVELDIWLASRELCGHGYGSEALVVLCGWLQANFGVNRFVLRPSRRNLRALRALRRAGFRSIDESAKLMRRMPGRPILLLYDAVTMMLALPPPPVRLDCEAGHTYVFLDSEFTGFRQPQLISVGAVATDATAFYCEISDWDRERASDFVKATVVPLLDGDAVPHTRAAAALGAWLSARTAGGPVTVITDSGFDRWALTALFGEDLPSGIDWRCVPLPYEALDAIVAAMTLRRHHALDDARGLRQALLHPQQAAAAARSADDAQAAAGD